MTTASGSCIWATPGYRYVTATEPLWQQYIDEAAQVGFNKIRTWFCSGRHDVAALFVKDRQGLDLAYWDEIERRLVYALEKYPHIQFQLIPYGEDWPELVRYGQGDKAALLVARYAQARFSAFPNVQWCFSNDGNVSPAEGGRNVAPATIHRIGRDMRAREPWGTLLTNHQKRFQGYSFVDADWSDIITLEDRDQVAGGLVLKYRALSRDDPVVLDEDRYGNYISPKHDRYFFRRLMWASLLSGGHATYGGLNTYAPYSATNKLQGMHGYLTAVRDGRLDDGAADFPHIGRFFAETGFTLVGLHPQRRHGWQRRTQCQGGRWPQNDHCLPAKSRLAHAGNRQRRRNPGDVSLAPAAGQLANPLVRSAHQALARGPGSTGDQRR
jgi:hypothetical protein